MNPVQNISMGRGGEEHDAADATMAAHVGHRFTGKVAIVTGAASGIGRATAQRLAAEGAVVAVNTVAPGPTDTAIIASFDLPEGADGKQLYKMMTPMDYATPAEMAASIAFLASDDSPFTTGAVLSVDGGLSV